MNGQDLFRGLNHVNPKFIEEAETATRLEGEKRLLSVRRPLVMAALIALLLMLVGCAVVYALHMQQIRIGQQQTRQDVFQADWESGRELYLGQETVTEDVLTLAGIQGSPNYQAAQEWFAFKQEYDPEGAILAELRRTGSLPEFPAEYEGYCLYSQEMKDKLDEILVDYGLKPVGRTVPFQTEELTCKALGLKTVLTPESQASMDLDYAAYQECGNLDLDFTLTLADGTPIQCHVSYLKKDAFAEDVIALGEPESWTEWNYTTAAGADVLIFRSSSDGRGYLFCDMPNYTVTVQFPFLREQYVTDGSGNTVTVREVMTDRQVEQLADAIDFSLEPRLTDGWETLTAWDAGSGETVNGYSMEVKSIQSDGIRAVITLGITAPEGVDLTQHDGFPLSLNPGNRWGFFEPASGEEGNVSGGYRPEDDGDGKANTHNVILCYCAGSQQIQNGEQPFAQGNVWRVYWQDLYGTYLNESTNEPETYRIAEATWSMDVEFDAVLPGELELIREPVSSRAAWGLDLKGNALYQDTVITSFLLRPMSASIFSDLEHGAPDFLTEEEGCIYAVMKDGSRAAFYGDSAGSGIQNLRTDAPIDLEQVSHVLLPDGTKLTVPQP